MHTQLEPGIDISVATNLKATFSWVPPFAAESHDSDDYLGGPESIAEEELDQAFDELDREKAETAAAAGVSDKVINNTHGVQFQAKSTIGWNLNVSTKEQASRIYSTLQNDRPLAIFPNEMLHLPRKSIHQKWVLNNHDRHLHTHHLASLSS